MYHGFSRTFVGVNAPDQVFRFYFIAAFYKDFIQISINSKILAMPDNYSNITGSNGVGAYYYAIKNGAGLCTFLCSNINSIVFDRYFF